MTLVTGGWNSRTGSVICPMTGKRAMGAEAKLLVPCARSIGSSTCLATTRLVYVGPLLPESETMKSVIAQRCSGVRASANDGIGVPLKPVLIVLKISSRDEPPRKVQLCERSDTSWSENVGQAGIEV